MKTFPASLSSLYEILRFIHGEVQESGFSHSDTRKIEIAVEEIVVNIISYSYKNISPEKATISINLSSLKNRKGIQISIQDQGVPYNPLTQTKPNAPLPLDNRPVGGLGIFLVLELMDKVNYKRKDNQNILTLVKYVEKQRAVI